MQRSATTTVKKFALATVSGAALAASPAAAQPAAPNDPASNGQATQGSPSPSAGPSQQAAANIVVTGSRIHRPNLESVVPVTSVQGEQFFQRGSTSIGDQLNDLPQLRSTFAQQNPGSGVGVAGLNLLDLRGLGSNRTLVLVNGRRHVAADILVSASVPDVNTISNDLIDRVDIVTGGNSAVYGSDAIAGVVNFILKRDFTGLQLRAQGSEAAAGFGADYIVSAMWGKNFNGGKGNITLQGEYSKQDRFFASDVPWYRRLDGFVVSDVDAGLSPDAHNSDGFPDRVLVQDVRSSTIHRYGLVAITEQNALAPCGTGLGGTDGGPSTVGGRAFNCTYIFNPDGSLVQQTGSRAGVGPNPSFIGGNGQNGREDRQVSVMPMNKHINLNLLGHYTVSEAFEPFIEAKWVRVQSTGNNSGPSFIQGTGTFDYRERFRLDNPFLNPAGRSTIANALLTSGCNPSLSAACGTAVDTSTDATNGGTGQGTGGRLSANDINLINSGAYRFLLAKNFTDLGLRDQAFTRDTWRVVTGLRGTFNEDWSYELSANYGQFNQNEHDNGYVDKQRFMLSLDAGRNPVTGQIQCRSQFDPAAAKAYSRAIAIPAIEVPERALEAARLAADIAACVPYNPFGATDNSAAIAYFSFNHQKHAKMTQFDVLGFVNGDSSQLFELPGGPVGFVLGGEYRRETALYHEDPFVLSNQSNAVKVGNFEPGPFHVAEAFAELNVPILKDMPFFHELSLSGAGRYSRYAAPTKGVWTYNVGGEWAPVRDVRFRGNFGKAVRAPNLSETAFPLVPNFAPTYQDPCSTTASTQGSGSRQAACLADVGALQSQIRNGTYSLGVYNGSNPNLVPEVSYSLTLGAVIQPRFIPGLSFSADYYSIKVKNVIVSVTARQIVENCYDLPAGNVFCSLFTRWRGPGLGPSGENPGEVLFNSIVQSGVNFAKRERKGIDFNANYRARLGQKVTLDTGLIWTHGLKTSNFENPATPGFENQILGELGDPKDEGRLDADLKVGAVTFGYNVHYISPMYINLAEDQISLPTACTTAGDPTSCPPNNADFATPSKFPAIVYQGFRVQWDTGPFMRAKNIQIYAGVDNLFDRHPPLGLTATGSGPGGFGNAGLYDVFGRKFFGGVKARF